MTLPVARIVPADRPAPAAARAGRPLLTVVVPTYNERENVGWLVTRIDHALAGIDAEIIFVDDSDDDTPFVVQRITSRHPITLIHRDSPHRAGGLGTAIAMGLERATGEYVCVLDGDLQHPPEKLTELLAAAQHSRADVVVASRYSPGGSAGGLTSRARKLISIASKWLSRVLFYEKLRATSDPGSGFFLIRREVVEDVELRPIGYKMLTEVLMRGRWSTIVEIPYCFQNRVAGSSKATLRQGVQYLQHTLRLFCEVPDAARLWKFLIVGASGVVVNLGLLWMVSVQAGLPRWAGWTTGVESSIVTNFLLNRSFTWGDRAASGLAMLPQAARYHLTCLAAVATNLAVFTTTSLFLGAPVMLAGLMAIGAGLTANFLGASTWVFQRPSRAPARVLPSALPQAVEVAADLEELRAA